MVICHKHRFIFVRIPKNASTSVAAYLINNYCTESDVYTLIHDAGIDNNNVPQRTLGKYRAGYQFIHLTPNQIIEEGIISRENSRAYDLYTILRNPFERLLSIYFFDSKQKGREPTPSDFRSRCTKGYLEGDTPNATLQTDYMLIGNRFMATIWLYEYLDTHLRTLESKYGRAEHSLKKYKTHYTPKEDKAKLQAEYFDEPTREAVKEYFHRDFVVYDRMKEAIGGPVEARELE